MRKISIILFLFLISLAGQGQNLVLNPGFEQFDTCPSNISQISRVTGWSAARPTPDYFNACSTDTLFNGQIIVGVPSNRMGYRTASSGDAYSGIISKGGSSEDREIIGSQLITPLQIGIRYYVSFQVSLAGQANPSQYCGINKLGALFSTTLYDSISLAPICSCPQVYSDSIIIDTLEWTRIKGSFIADSNYSFINVGRFFSNSQTDSIQIAGTLGFAYYFIDDVCVSTDSLTCSGIQEGIPEKDNNFLIQVFPNPASDWMEIRGTEIETISLCDALGRVVYFNSEFISPSRIDVSAFPPGIYFVKAETKNSTSVQKVLLVVLE